MLELSKQIIHNLTEIANTESKVLPKWIDKKYVANCVVPPLSSEDNVHCKIAVAAPVSAGKSSLFNALCGYPILPVASKTTSAVPTYITRVEEQSQECVTVYGIKKEIIKTDELTTTRFVRDPDTKRTYYAKDITKDMFDDLFEYMYLITHGNDPEHKTTSENAVYEYKTTIENVAYFMKTIEKSDILFNGYDDQKRTITMEDFNLTYDNPRHRFMLLLILLCVYVDQNDSAKDMDVYTKEVNTRRTKLFEKYKFPVGSDYCVCLDWCSDDIPENVTLIDLPGTGASTNDTDTHSSHTALVREILTEADAIWVLCSDNGTADPDLLNALNDTVNNNSRKNKVCIYNCKNGRPHDSGPVKDFLKKLPCLTGERCYVVDALAGEYKYTKNGINALYTKTASDIRVNEDIELTEADMIKKLETRYSGEKKAYCTFTTGKDAGGNIIAVQDSKVRYTLDSFFKSALADYVERLKYEVALTEAIRQAKFHIYIRDSLSSSRSILESIGEKGEDISTAVNEALSSAMRQAYDDYAKQMVEYQTILGKKLETLGETVGEKIKKEFLSSLMSLIDSIKKEWRTLEQKGHPNCLEANTFGNYPLKVDHPNWAKFVRVRTSAESKISISAFDSAFKIADIEIKKYSYLLTQYINNLKKTTNNFANNYINAFLKAFDKKRDELCKSNGNRVTDNLYRNFNNTREKLKEALESELKAVCVNMCDSFDVLTDKNGIFDKLCQKTDRFFRDRFCKYILDEIREFMGRSFTNIMSMGGMRPRGLHLILNNFLNNFSHETEEYTNVLSRLIDATYGVSVLCGENFLSSLSATVCNFEYDKIRNFVLPGIINMHQNFSSLVSFGASIAVDVSAQIEELDKAICDWAYIGKHYYNIYKVLEDSDAENTMELYVDCKRHIDEIINARN